MAVYISTFPKLFRNMLLGLLNCGSGNLAKTNNIQLFLTSIELNTFIYRTHHPQTIYYVGKCFVIVCMDGYVIYACISFLPKRKMAGICRIT